MNPSIPVNQHYHKHLDSDHIRECFQWFHTGASVNVTYTEHKLLKVQTNKRKNICVEIQRDTFSKQNVIFHSVSHQVWGCFHKLTAEKKQAPTTEDGRLSGLRVRGAGVHPGKQIKEKYWVINLSSLSYRHSERAQTPSDWWHVMQSKKQTKTTDKQTKGCMNGWELQHVGHRLP